MKINKHELTNPYKHIIIDHKTGKPVMIDFERCSFTNHPKNITQFIQFLCSGKFENAAKSIKVNKEKLRTIAKEYKNSNKDDKKNKEIVEQILEQLK